MNENGILYVVGTPIGNMEDITLRAIKILNNVDLILAEDTRRTAKLLNNYYIKCTVMSYHDRNKEKKTNSIVAQLVRGKKIALVSDAGTPGISDPAYYLLNRALKENVKIIPVPGVSAVITAMSVAGLPTDRFTFYGFLPRKKGKKEAVFSEILNRNETAVIFESPHRFIRTLELIEKVFTAHRIFVGKEMTKVKERYLRGSAQDMRKLFNEGVVKGEITIVIKPYE